MEIKKSLIKGLLQINSSVFPDDRGFFKEVLRINEVEKISGIKFEVRQFNHARSAKNTLRGIHVAPWSKLLYVTKGVIQLVVVDTRIGSPTYGKYESFILGDGNRSSILVPANCGNSYLVLSNNADFVYLTDQEFIPNTEKGIAWNDPVLNIDWKLEGEPLLSEKDKNNSSFATFK